MRITHHVLYGLILHFALVVFVILFIRLLRYQLPNLSGIDETFPDNVSRTLKAREFNAWRVQRANATLERISSHWTTTSSRRTLPKDRLNVTVSIVVVASGREGDFLSQVIASLLQLHYNTYPRTQSSTPLPFSLTLCDVSTHPDAEIRRLSKFVPTIKVTSKSHKSDRLTNYAEKIKKESDDYWNCLRLTNNARYVLLIEDDAIPVPHFMPLLNSVVQQMDSNPQIDFVKLYHPRYLRKIPYYFQISLTCLAICVLLTGIIWRQIRWLPLIVTFTFLIYHIHIHYNCQIFADLRYALTSSSAYLTVAESCCTPAVIYRTDSINRMLSYFVGSTSDSEPVFMIDNDTVIGRKSSEIRAPFKWLKADNNGTQLNIGGRLKHPKWPSSFAKDDQLDGSPFVSRQTDTNLVIHIGYISAIRGKLVILDAIRELERRAEHIFPF